MSVQEYIDLVVRYRVEIITTPVVLSLTYLVTLALYRLYLSPIANVPGPKLAALTRWYEFYYDCVLPGQFTFHIQELHKQYGPIVRITPVEVHIQDSSYFDELYGRSGRRDKDPWAVTRFGNSKNIFTTAGHDLHRTRRAPLNPMFSKKRILELQPMIRSKVEKLCARIAEYKKEGKVLPLNRAFESYAGDVVLEYSFDISYNLLDFPDFKQSFHDAFVGAGKLGVLVIQFPLLFPILTSMPEWFVVLTQPAMRLFMQLQKDIRKHITELKYPGEDAPEETRKIVFHEVLESDLSIDELLITRVADEALNIVAAGLETVAWALTVGSFHIINNPSTASKLRQELIKASPRSAQSLPEWTKLEQLPYLTACAREAIRLAYALSTRSARLNPDGPMKYKQYTLPKNTPISMSLVDMSHDEAIYPDSHSFIPERWLNNPKTPEGKSLETAFVGFGRGARSCLGLNLAQAEMHLALAAIFRRFDFELYETDVSDVTLAHDYFMPQPKLDSKGVRVRVVGESK